MESPPGGTALLEQPFQMNAALFRCGLTSIKFTVYSYLKSCCGGRNACTVNIRTIAALCNCSRSSAKQALHALKT